MLIIKNNGNKKQMKQYCEPNYHKNYLKDIFQNLIPVH